MSIHANSDVSRWPGVRGASSRRTVSGIGNVYADEILFQAGIHPRRSASALDRRELSRLFTKLQKVLRKAIAARADPARMPKSFLLPPIPAASTNTP